MAEQRRRLIGLETEYGCLVGEGLPIHQVIGQLRDWFFENQRYGLIDKHHRDWDEQPGNGGFLFNGGRVYEDMGHLEMCTPECASFLEVVRYDRANDRMLAEALHELGLEDSVSLIRNNVDHYTGATFGCHENYSMNRNVPTTDESIFSLLAYLTLRSLYTGSGRVGGLEIQRQLMREGPNALLENFKGFQMTQRADYVENDFFRWVQGNRAIINTRDEPLADPSMYRRLHLLHGDTNVLPAAAFLKLGTTSLVLDLLEIGEMPEVRVLNPVGTLKQFSYDPDGPWDVVLHDGAHVPAVNLLELYRERAAQHFQGRDDETDALLALWKQTNDALQEGETTSLVGILDWVTKKYLFEHFCEAEGILMTDAWLESQDLEFHQVIPERNLGLPLSKEGPWSVDLEAAVTECFTEPPSTTRAAARSRLMKQIDPVHDDYIVDWDSVRWSNQVATLSDPYNLDPTIRENEEDIAERLSGWPSADLD